MTAALEAILLDPVYSGKGMAGLDRIDPFGSFQAGRERSVRSHGRRSRPVRLPPRIRRPASIGRLGCPSGQPGIQHRAPSPDRGRQSRRRPTGRQENEDKYGIFLPRSSASRQAPAMRGRLDKIKSSGTITIGHRDASIPFSYPGRQSETDRLLDGNLREGGRGHQGQAGHGADQGVNLVPVTSSTRIPLVANGTVDGLAPPPIPWSASS